MRRLRRVRFAWTPLHARPTQLRRALGRTPPGGLAKRTFRGRSGPTFHADRRQLPAGGRVLLVSHCGFSGSSASHALELGRGLAKLGYEPTVAVPTTRGAPSSEVSVVSYRQALRDPRFDFVHAFTPRPQVRALVAALDLPFVAHLEDNEETVATAIAGAYDHAPVDAFLAAAAAITVIVDALLALVPSDVPVTRWWPGYDERLDGSGRAREDVLRDVGLPEHAVAVVYTGNIHAANRRDMRALYDAVAAARETNPRVALVRTGWSSVPWRALRRSRAGSIDLGFIERSRVLDLVRAADVLVQPGRPGAFDDYRFPSKIPDFLASGNAAILPRTNLGLELDDGDQALLLEHGDPAELAAAILRLADDAALRAEIGQRGREFARSHLRWEIAARRVAELYELARARR